MIDLQCLSALFIAFALMVYILLDGFDLGVGVLLLLQSDETMRDRMVASITPTWDGNETWLIMAAVALFAGFPIAYGILLPAFYLPLVAMLIALGLRGVSFEFRVQGIAGRRWWDAAFAVGSLVAAAMQGLVAGALVQGVNVHGVSFGGTVWDVFRPFPLLCAAALLCGYVTLGAAWLHFKGTDELKEFAARTLRRTTPLFMAMAAATWSLAAVVQPRMTDAWTREPIVGTLLVLSFLAAGLGATMIFRPARDGTPLGCALVMFAAGLLGLVITVFPYLVPFRLKLWDAASARSSHVFLLIGAAVVAPVVLAYSAFAYRVFRGKTPMAGW
jgi:cytochrome bd ubiquinol oxidase subunit II